MNQVPTHLAEGSRRLAAVVAVDMAGYSARTEANEEAAAAAVADLAKAVEATCGDHGGRVFNSAGDGFMLEFPTVSGAMGAALSLLERDQPAVRVGAHLGEVRVTPTGDLLGHTVNVAARLQALAPVGGLLVSADVRRAVRGELAARLAPQGQVRLSKMAETISVYRLIQPRRPKVRSQLTLVIAAAIVIALLLGYAGLQAWPHRPWRGAEPRVAVLPFDTAGDAALKPVAGGLSDQIAGMLSANHVLTLSERETSGLSGDDGLSAARRQGATFALDGALKREGEALHATVRIEDARDNLILWSGDFSQPAATPEVLQTEVAAKVANLIGLAVAAQRDTHLRLQPADMADFLRGADAVYFNPVDSSLEAREILRRLTARVPAFSHGHSLLAYAIGLASHQAPPAQKAQLRAEGVREAEKALALDPNNGEAYLALHHLNPESDWATHDRLLLKGLQVEPGHFQLNNSLGYIRAAEGRTLDGIAALRIGLAANPLHPGANYKYALMLATAGRPVAARQAIDRTVQLWPTAWTDIDRVMIVVATGPRAEARAVIDRAMARPFANEAAALRVWNEVLAALEDGGAGRKALAAQAAREAYQSNVWQITHAVVALTLLGDHDGVFAIGEAEPEHLSLESSDVLFAPWAAGLRADPRFWPLAARLRLADYWLQTRSWPDICGADVEACEAQARAAVLALKPSGGRR